jgi:hypothetical protein
MLSRNGKEKKSRRNEIMRVIKVVSSIYLFIYSAVREQRERERAK